MRLAECMRLVMTGVLAVATGAWAAQTVPEAASDLAALPDAGRGALERRRQAWDALPEPMRRDRREAWLTWRALPAAERERMGAAREAFLALPVAEQQSLRAEFDALDASVRRGWLLGPVLGADWPRLHALLAQVPVVEREVLLVAVRELTPEARADLGVLAQRTPPQAREALRQALLAQPAEQRAAWLRGRVSP